MQLFFYRQKTAYEMRISDWSSDVCSSDLFPPLNRAMTAAMGHGTGSAIDIVLTREFTLNIPAADAEDLSFLSVRTGLKDRKRVVSGKSVSVRVDLGGRRIITTKNSQTNQSNSVTN